MIPAVTLSLRDIEIAAYKKDPALFVRRELREEPSEDQAAILRDCADLNNKFIIISAGRGAGKTKVVSWIVAWSIAILPTVYGRYDTNILGGSAKQSQMMNSYFKTYIPLSPLLKEKLKGDPRAYHTDFRDGRVAALAASEHSIRAPHVDLLVLDEVCSADDNLVEQALPQVTGARHGRIIMLSTPHKYFGVFRKYWDRAEQFGFRKYGPWSLERCAWNSPELLAMFKESYSPDRYKVEVLGEFPDTGISLWPSTQIDAAVAPEPFAIHPSYQCDFGVDWGQAVPFATVLTPVQYINGKVYIPGPPHIWEQEYYMTMVNRIIDVYKRERGQTIYADSSHRGENERLEVGGCDIERVVFSGNKGRMVETLSVLLHQGRLVISPDQSLLIRQMKEASWVVNEKTGSQKIRKQPGNDDCVDSLMTGLWRLQEEDILDDTKQDEFLGL